MIFPDAPQQLEGEWAATAVYNLAGAALSSKNIAVASSLFDMASVLCSFQAATVPLVLPARRLALMCFLDAAASCSSEQLEHAALHLKALRAANAMDKDELLLLEFRTSLLDPSFSAAEASMAVSRLASVSASPYLLERVASACLQQRKSGLADAALAALVASFRLHSSLRPVAVERAAVVVRNLVGLAVLAGAEALQQVPLREMADMAKSEPSWPLTDRQYLAVEIWNIGAREWRRARFGWTVLCFG